MKQYTVLLSCNTVFAMLNFRGGVIRELIASGKRVVVVAPADSYLPELKALGVEHIEWDINGRSTSILAEIIAILQLKKIYSLVRPDVAFHYTIKSIVYGALVCRFLRVPFISVVTGLGYVFINDGFVCWFARTLYKATLRWSKEVWLLNDDDRQTMESKGLLIKQNVRILPGEGINTSFFSPSDLVRTQKPCFLLIARLLRDKGVLEFVEAARILLRNGVNAEFVLLGAVDAENPTALTSKLVREWESEGVVKYLGVCKDVRPFIAGVQCIVLPSYREGVPRTLLEASAMARPIIATDVPGCRDVVVDGETGFLCEARSADSLAGAITRFLNLSEDDRRKMGERGRQFVSERFDEKLVLERYEKTLIEILHGSISLSS